MSTEKLYGEIDSIIFKNEENGYTVCVLSTDKEDVTLVGYMPGIGEGDTVCVTGNWTNHQVYGEQFKVDMYERQTPADEKSILRYLSSGIVKGVREATAKKIVDMFGSETLEIIHHHPLRLADIKGISAEKAMKIHESYVDKMGAANLVMFLQEFGISIKMAAKIHKKYGSMGVEIIKNNPYILCEEIEGIGFKTADEIALGSGKDRENSERLKAGTLYTLRYNTMLGHTYLPIGYLVKSASQLLNVDEIKIYPQIEFFVRIGTFVEEKTDTEHRIYYFSVYNAEKETAEKLSQLCSADFGCDVDKVYKDIEKIEKQNDFTFAPLQKEAILDALRYGVVVITGGPGTGKTTIVNTIISLMQKRNLNVSLCAPTGRAAKRMSQVCSIEAKTVHRLLEVGYSEDDEENIKFFRNEENPLTRDVIIVDEMSMMDIHLMNCLLKAVMKGTRLIMIGDSNQLPSVGCGNVLKDIISSGCVPVAVLKDIFRQSKESMIVVNAHRINNGEYPEFNKKDGDFFYMNEPDAAKGAELILSLVSERLPKAYGVEPGEIQVLSCTKKGLAGVANLNTLLQQRLNPKSKGKKEKQTGAIIFREGDRVMQTKNNYDIKWTDIETGHGGDGIFNGDVGYIQKINYSYNTVTILFDGRLVEYDFKNLDELDLAYALTVHKSQGSEFDIMVMPVYEAPYMLTNRNMFYTAVTRAKKKVILVGSDHVIKRMVDNNTEAKRYTGLKDRLMEISERL
ncbi:MAG: ATP-dependent RecD-like DNA helicase [Ruminococcaceae bacterium]|nr:ATP-dependent RecD-like DNA helicase [Oscillospiraceae bacterium]